MAILRSVDGRFYEIPDDQLSKYLIPEDKVKEKVQAAGGDAGPPEDPGPPPPSGSPAIIVQIFGAAGAQPAGGGAPAPTAGAGEVQPYAWWNTWRNTYGPSWHNVWHNRWH
jgi:hypothetical protein